MLHKKRKTKLEYPYRSTQAIATTKLTEGHVPAAHRPHNVTYVVEVIKHHPLRYMRECKNSAYANA
jgi:hypothetical protein